MLIAREVPPYGGDTLFANTYLAQSSARSSTGSTSLKGRKTMSAAYETLSEGVKRMLDGLIAVNYSAKADVTRTREDRLRDGGKAEAKKEYISEHPVVRTHPETGRKALYVNIGFTQRFEGWDRRTKARPLLRWLYEHCAKPEFTCRFAWEKNAVACSGTIAARSITR